ncbi:MAG TPA: hypothetical protein VNZ22_23285, partial [Bacillota bacterium]|nr:hypothetical protein [Bacillota bacterium]
MRNFKQIILISGISVAVAVAGLTGCASWSKGSGGRTAGRVVDDKNINGEVKTKLTKEPVYKFTDVDVKTF